MLDDSVGASSLATGTFCVHTYGTRSAAADVGVLVLNDSAATSSFAKGTFSTGTGGTCSAAADVGGLGLTLSTPAHRRQLMFQDWRGAVCQQGLGVIEYPGRGMKDVVLRQIKVRHTLGVFRHKQSRAQGSTSRQKGATLQHYAEIQPFTLFCSGVTFPLLSGKHH